MTPSHLLRDVRLPDGSTHDVTIVDGVVARLDPPGTGTPFDPGTTVHDLAGWLVTPSLVEPHAHLDKTLTAARIPNPTGDLAGAVRSWIDARGTLTADDLHARALRVLARASASGVTTLRTHVDTGGPFGAIAVEVLADLRRQLVDVVDLQIFVGHGLPVTGLGSDETADAARAALRGGADGIGGAPNLDGDPRAALDRLIDLAQGEGVPLDLHVDETLDPAQFVLEHLAARAALLRVPMTVDHVVSLSVQPTEARHRVADLLAAAGVGVVTLPQSNLYLQGRGLGPARPRGLTAIDDLLAAGVTVAGGSDNVGDPFNPMGRADPLETASLLVTAGHLTPSQAFDAVTASARRVVGLPVTTVAPGQPADLLVAPADDVADLIATAPAERLVFRHGRLVAATAVSRSWAGSSVTHPHAHPES